MYLKKLMIFAFTHLSNLRMCSQKGSRYCPSRCTKSWSLSPILTGDYFSSPGNKPSLVNFLSIVESFVDFATSIHERLTLQALVIVHCFWNTRPLGIHPGEIWSCYVWLNVSYFKVTFKCFAVGTMNRPVSIHKFEEVKMRNERHSV